MKKNIKRLLNRFHFDIVRLERSEDYLREKVTPRIGRYDTPRGSYFLPLDAPHDSVVNCIKHGRVFEPEVVEIARDHIKRGSTVLDLGANFGQMSLLFSELTGSTGDVYSFEADDFIFDLLKKNISANHGENIRPIFGAAYNVVGKTVHFPIPDFQRFGSYGSYGIDLNATSGRSVETITIDSLSINTPISFMKVDVQGSDLFAMQGAVETIRRHKMPILFEFEQQFQSEFKTSFQDYVDFIESIDYKFSKVIMGINYLVIPKQSYT